MFSVIALSTVITNGILQNTANSDEGSEHIARELSEARIDNTENDQRLPPTIPGQEMVVGGKKVKVTSTSGPVPVSQPPEPWKDQHKETVKDIFGSNGGVIVDDRGARDNQNSR